MRRMLEANDGERRSDPVKSKSKSGKTSSRKVDAPQAQSDCACGGICPTCRANAQALPVSRPGDASEREADSIAARVVRGESAAGMVRARKPGAEVATSANHSAGGAAKRLSQSALQSSRSGGQALEPRSRASMGMRLGADLGAVRIHNDDESARMSKALNAKAFTVGSHVYFGAGRYRPESSEGERLLAHELVHVLQQNGSGSERVQRDLEDESIEDDALFDSGDESIEDDAGEFGPEIVGDDAEEMQGGRARCRAERNFSFSIMNLRNFEFTVPRGCSATLTFSARWESVNTGEGMCCTGNSTYQVVRNEGRPQNFRATSNNCGDVDPAPPAIGTMTVGGGRQRFRINVDRQGCSGVALSVNVNIRIR